MKHEDKKMETWGFGSWLCPRAWVEAGTEAQWTGHSHSRRVTIIPKRRIIISNQVKSNNDIAKKLRFSYPRSGKNLTSIEEIITELTVFYIKPNYESCKLQKQQIKWKKSFWKSVRNRSLQIQNLTKINKNYLFKS